MHGPSVHAALVPLFATLAAIRAIAATDIGVCGSPGCTATAQAGIALLQRKRTLGAVDAGDGEGPTGASAQDVAALPMAHLVGAAVANASAAHGAPCVGNGCGHSWKAKQADTLIAAPESWNISVNETSQFQAKQADTLIAAPEPRKISVNETTASRHESPPAYSLSAAGPGDGLSGSVISSPGEPASHNESDLPLPPIAQEHIEPFGYPGAGILLELHLPKVTLRELHTSSRGSLAQFLLEVREEIGKGAEVHESRLSILSIHGRYKRYDSDGYFRMRSDRTDHMAGSQHLEEEVVVRFEILPGWAQDVDPQTALNVLREQLASPDSGIMKGPLGMILANSTLTLSTPAGMVSQSRMGEHHGITHMSAMAWPIGISAAFIGVLIWLAAY